MARRAAELAMVDRHPVLDTLGRILLARGDCVGAAATFQEALAAVLPEIRKRGPISNRVSHSSRNNAAESEHFEK